MSDNLNWNEEESQAPQKTIHGVFQKATVAALLVSSAVSVYIALYLAGINSINFYLLFLSGAVYVVLALSCWKGTQKAFQVAVIWAVIRSVIDITLNSISFGSLLYMIPQLFVILFAALTLVNSS